MAEVSLHKPFPAAEVAGWDFETDVAIVGFGATGACAAIEAADAGAQVMLFERNSGSGGASGLSGGEIYLGGGGGTDAQRAAGFEDSTEDFIAYLKAAGGPCVDEAKCEHYGHEALNHFAWLKAQGVQSAQGKMGKPQGCKGKDQCVNPNGQWHQNHKSGGKQSARCPHQAGGRTHQTGDDPHAQKAQAMARQQHLSFFSAGKLGQDIECHDAVSQPAPDQCRQQHGQRRNQPHG